MASIRKRNQLWQVQVRSKNIGSITKSFHKKSDAHRFAIEQEALMQSGKWQKPVICNLTIGDMMKEYARRVTPQKKGMETELRRIRRLLEEIPLMSVFLNDAPLYLRVSETNGFKTEFEPVSMISFYCDKPGIWHV